jgi:hypothetical protein
MRCVIMTKILFSLMVLLSLSACGQSPKEELLNAIKGIPNDKAMFFSGNYQANCQAISFGGQKLYTKEKLVFSGMDVGSDSNGLPTVSMSAFNDESSLYLDSSCQKILATQTSKGKYTFGKENKEITLDSTYSSLVSKDSTMTAALNSQSFCGFTDWANDSSKDLLKGNCADQVKSVHAYVNSLDDDASVIELIQCSDEEMKQCQKVRYFRN